MLALLFHCISPHVDEGAWPNISWLLLSLFLDEGTKNRESYLPTFIFLTSCEAWMASPCWGHLEWAFGIPMTFSQEALCFCFCRNSGTCPVVINGTFFFPPYHFHPFFHEPEPANFLTFSETCHAISLLCIITHTIFSALNSLSLLFPLPGKLLFILQIPVLLNLYTTKCIILCWLFVSLSCYPVAVQMAWTITYIPKTWLSVCAKQILFVFLTKYKIP